MPDEGRLSGKTALVVGASSGIGYETADRLGANGASVAVAARREEKLTELTRSLQEDYGTDALAVPTDVTEEDEVRDMVESTVEEFSSLDFLVYSAGEGRSSNVEEMTTEEYRVMMDVLVDGVYFTTQSAIPHLRKTNGSIVYIGSFAAHFPYPSNPIYGAAKWWTRGFAKSIGGELGDAGISVSIVNPSEVRTEWGEEYGQAFKDRFNEGEALHPAQVAEGILFALTQDAPAAVEELNLYRKDRMSEF